MDVRHAAEPAPAKAGDRLIKELAKRFDAAITQVEVLSTKAEDAEAEV